MQSFDAEMWFPRIKALFTFLFWKRTGSIRFHRTRSVTSSLLDGLRVLLCVIVNTLLTMKRPDERNRIRPFGLFVQSPIRALEKKCMRRPEKAAAYDIDDLHAKIVASARLPTRFTRRTLSIDHLLS